MSEPVSTQPRGGTLIFCGTVLLLACIGGILYLSNSTQPNLAAMGLLGVIVASVLAGTFGLTKLSAIENKVDRTVHQTNGGLDARMEAVATKAVEQALRAAGLPPVAPGTSPITKQEEAS